MDLVLINAAMEHIGIGTAGLVALLGYVVVFFGLVLLMVVIMVAGKIMASKKKAAPAPVPAPAPAAPAAKVEKLIPEAPGSAGECKLFDVDDKTAAILMAIVANKLDKPLNTLRFQSIKEVK